MSVCSIKGQGELVPGLLIVKKDFGLSDLIARINIDTTHLVI